MKTSLSCPSSSSNFWFNLLVVGLFFSLILFVFRFFPVGQTRVLGIVVCLFIAAGILAIKDLYYLKVYKDISTGLTQANAFDRQRVVIKLIGLYGTFLIILGLYWINPFYRESSQTIIFYGYFFDFIGWIMPWVMLCSLAYFPYIDSRQKDPYDSYWHMGCLLTGRWKAVNGIFLMEHGRVWFIKAFFTPFMFALLVKYLNLIFLFDWKHSLSFLGTYNHLLNIFYTFDIFYGVLGYLLTLRIINTHIQSTEPTILGWLVCLVCYDPFYNLIGIGRSHYDSGFTWDQWLMFAPVWYYLCGLSIICLTAIYGLATVAFGYRMSNLTYRGIITDGPYRFTKHPAYLAKVTSWWLISLPFFSILGTAAAVKQTVALVAISVVYYLRAKTEENHLSNYSQYVEYALWINEYGSFRTFKKWFPFLRYSVEKAKRSNSVAWFKKLS